MFYFFEKNQRFLQCEIRNTDAPETFEIVLTDPEGQVHTHCVTGSAELHRRWLSLQSDLHTDGWWGPSGRD